MAQSDISKSLRILQSMINVVLVEVGKSLLHLSKDGSKAYISPNTRQSNALSVAMEKFHQALDDIETEILLSNACLLRQLDKTTTSKELIDISPSNGNYEKCAKPETLMVIPEHLKANKSFEALQQFNALQSQQALHAEYGENQIQEDLDQPSLKTQSSTTQVFDKEIVPQELAKFNMGAEASQKTLESFSLPSDVSKETHPNLHSQSNLDIDLKSSNNETCNISQNQNSNIKSIDIDNNLQDCNMTGYPINEISPSSANNNQEVNFSGDLNSNFANATVQFDSKGINGPEDCVFNDVFFEEGDNALKGVSNATDLSFAN